MTSRARDPERGLGLLCLVATVLGWGVNWPVVKVVLAEWPPLFARGTAGLVGAAAVALVAAMRREALLPPRDALPALLLGAFTNVFAWMGFGTIAMVWLPVGEAALLVYTMPIWATLFAWPMLGARPTRRGVVALVAGAAGVAVLIGGVGPKPGGQAIGIAAALASAIFMALGTVRQRAAPLRMPPLAATAWQVGLGCLPMAVFGLLAEAPDLGALDRAGWLAMAYMAFVPMGICYLTWFATLRRLPPPVAATSMLMVPAVGTLAAAIALGEVLGARELAAFALVLGGVALAIRGP